MEVQLAIRGRGLFFSRTPDGTWWRLRLRPRPCRDACEDRAGWDDAPPDGAVREPCRPLGPGPRAGMVAIAPSAPHGTRRP